jgi:DNA-directed RNA polymerase III subunit RPC9
MKVIESQSAVLTNFEVYHHLTTRPLGSRKVNKRGPKDFESLKEEVCPPHFKIYKTAKY